MTDPSKYYSNRETKERIYGFAAYRVPNKEKFSYRAALVQNEWQKKSAGSVLYGGEIYYVIGPENDSTFIPKLIEDNYVQKGYFEMRYISIGPGIGYAYALVIKKHFYVLASAIINGNINFSTDENGSIKNKRTSFGPGVNFKTAAGYGGPVWNVSLSWAGNVLLVKQANIPNANTFPTSEVRLTLARQIILKKPIPVVGNAIDKILGKE